MIMIRQVVVASKWRRMQFIWFHYNAFQQKVVNSFLNLLLKVFSYFLVFFSYQSLIHPHISLCTICCFLFPCQSLIMSCQFRFISFSSFTRYNWVICETRAIRDPHIYIYCNIFLQLLEILKLKTMGFKARLNLVSMDKNWWLHMVMWEVFINNSLRNFLTMWDRDFMFVLYSSLEKPFQLTQKSMTLWPWLYLCAK